MLHDLLNSARSLHDLGLNVVVLEPGSKRPTGSWKTQQSERLQWNELRELLARSGHVNLGVIHGRVSGTTAIDADTLQDAATLRTLLPANTPSVLTRKGAHFFLRFDGERCSTGSTYSTCEAGAVSFDVRGEGGLTVVPPSRVGGHAYRWSTPLKSRSQLAPIPFKVDEPTRAAPAGSAASSRWADELQARASTGSRNATLVRIAGWLARGVRRSRVDRAAYLQLLHIVNASLCDPPLPQSEVDELGGWCWRQQERRPRRQT